VRRLLEPRHERACSLQRQVEVVDTKEQEEPVARCRVIGTRQRGMVVGAPLVETEQDGSVRVEELAKVGVVGRRLRLPEE
jgi:hypothetical protein